ncbi:IS21-like element helper ATPase IstB [Cystobacter fuscus]|uniref:IS21-like element helper ATPase IstB n=1 Tax=Cystobacter fuscus TaxID=43 RepID=UPI0037BEF15C
MATDLVGLLADAEWMHRENKKLSTRLQHAKLRQQACLEDIDYGHARALTKAQVMELATSKWVEGRQNVLLTGPTGVGKSFLACALGQKACRDGYSVVYRRASRLFNELAQARADGTHPNVLKRLAKAQVLILDDFGLEQMSAAERKELLEVLEDRYQVRSTVVTSQLEPKDWHAVIGDATLADAILNRLVHNAHRLKLADDSIGKVDVNLTKGHKQVK